MKTTTLNNIIKEDKGLLNSVFLHGIEDGCLSIYVECYDELFDKAREYSSDKLNSYIQMNIMLHKKDIEKYYNQEINLMCIEDYSTYYTSQIYYLNKLDFDNFKIENYYS